MELNKVRQIVQEAEKKYITAFGDKSKYDGIMEITIGNLKYMISEAKKDGHDMKVEDAVYVSLKILDKANRVGDLNIAQRDFDLVFLASFKVAEELNNFSDNLLDTIYKNFTIRLVGENVNPQIIKK